MAATNIPLAIALGILSSLIYAVTLVVQHRTISKPTDMRGFAAFVHIIANPLLLLSIGGDLIGTVIHIAALAEGPVVVVQPTMVLMLPMAMFIGAFTGGPRPTGRSYLAAVAICIAVAAFLATAGNEKEGVVASETQMLVTGVLFVTLIALAVLATLRAPATLKGMVLGGTAGIAWGVMAAYVNAANGVVQRRSFWSLLTTDEGLIPTLAVAIFGIAGTVLMIQSFRVGSIASTMPVNLIADPLSAVALGVLMLDQRIPHGTSHIAVYAACTLVVVVGLIQLAADEAAHRGHAGAPSPG